MRLPNLSSLMYVAHLRYIQSIHEPPDLRNPDSRVGHFIPVFKRLQMAWWLSAKELSRLRADPFYYYLVARTRYYDEVIKTAVSSHGVQHIVSVGCGTDTRPYRFESLLRDRHVKFLECDQPYAIKVKQRMVKRWRRLYPVDYLPIDLNDDAWPEMESALRDRSGSKVLVLMEGVSPYVNDTNVTRFLRLLATKLAPGSRVAYDFKLRGIKDDFGRAERVPTPFRLPSERREIAAFHEALGFKLELAELSSALSERLLPSLAGSTDTRFREDGLVQLTVA